MSYALAHIADTNDPHKVLPAQTGHAGAGLVTDGSKVSWSPGAAGTVTGVSVVSANGFAGTVATSTTTPAITLTTTITGLLKGNGTAISASVVTDDVQTKAAIVPNTAPGSGQILVGNGGGTAYAPVTASGAVTVSSAGAFSLATPATLTVSTVNAGGTTAHTHAITSSSAPGAAAALLATDASGILGTTGARIVKIWAIDLTVTNAIAGSVTGSAATWTTARNLAGNSVDGSGNVPFANKFVVQGTADTGLSAAQFLGALATGIVKNTTTTGVLSIAIAADFPTLNQNTTGSAATLTTPRSIYGNNFDGSAALAQIIASTFGGTGNGFTKFSGPATSEKTFTLPNASATILTDNAAVTVAQGGTGDTGTAWTTYTPTITSGSGTITTLGTVSGRYKRLGRTMFIEVDIAITTNGTAAGSLFATLPLSLINAANFTLAGREINVTGFMLQGRCAATAGNIEIQKYDGTYLGGNGSRLVLSGVIETTT